MKLKQILAQRKLRKLAEKQKHNPVLPNLNSAKLIGVIWHPTQREAFHYLKEYFNKEQVIFRGFCVFEEGVNPQANFRYYQKQSLKLVVRPTKIIIST